MQTQAKQTPQVKQTIKPLLFPQAPAGEEGRVEAVFDAVQKRMGFIPDGLRLYSFSPPLLEAFVGNVAYFHSGERLSHTLMAMIRYLVAFESKCSFCLDQNEASLINMGLDLDAIRAARGNPELAPVTPKEKPLLLLALKAVNDPSGVSEADIQAAKAQGWTDREAFDVVAQAASLRAFSYVLRTFKVGAQGVFA